MAPLAFRMPSPAGPVGMWLVTTKVQGDRLTNSSGIEGGSSGNADIVDSDRVDSDRVDPQRGKASLEQLAQEFSSGYRSVGSMVYEVLKDAILSGALAPGEKLRQETLAEAIGVSRLPVRSALIQLEAESLVIFHERRGAMVSTLSEAQVREIYELRTVLEGFALREAIRTMTPERLARLRALAIDADAQGDGHAFVEARNRFYDELYGSQSRPMLAQIIADLRLKVGGYLLGRRMDSVHGHSHSALVDVVAGGDADTAVDVLARHLQAVCDGVVLLLDPQD